MRAPALLAVLAVAVLSRGAEAQLSVSEKRKGGQEFNRVVAVVASRLCTFSMNVAFSTLTSSFSKLTFRSLRARPPNTLPEKGHPIRRGDRPQRVLRLQESAAR